MMSVVLRVILACGLILALGPASLDARPARGGVIVQDPGGSPSTPAPVAGAVRVTRADAIFRVGPSEDFDRRTPLAAGVVLRVSRREGTWLLADVGGGDAAWVQEKDVEWLPEAAVVPAAEVRNVLIRAGEGATLIDVQLSRRVAFDVVENTDPVGVELRLHDATLHMNELAQFAGDALVRHAGVVQRAPGSALLTVQLAGRGLWGWQATYVDTPGLAADPPGHDFSLAAPVTLRLALKWAPAADGLRGLCVVVDPGHGGDDTGATGPAGVHEKDVNLAVGLAFRDRLAARGARVVMTRDVDRATAVRKDDELARRVELARDGGGQVFVSIHHNARPRVADSRVARGTYVYYYHAQSADLARAMTDPLAAAAGEDHRATIWRSFHVIRQPYMPAVLVEVTFISNPDMEARMRDADYAGRIADGLVRGLEAFMAGRGGGRP